MKTTIITILVLGLGACATTPPQDPNLGWHHPPGHQATDEGVVDESVVPDNTPKAASPFKGSCAKVVELPEPVGGGNPDCTVGISVTVTCSGSGPTTGRLYVVWGEATSSTLYAASMDGRYVCDQPVVLTRDGVPCSDPVAADAVWWTPGGDGPVLCGAQ